MPTPTLAIFIKMSGGPLPPNTRAGDVEIYDNGRLVIYETDTDLVERQVDRQEILSILQFARQVGFFQLPSVIHDGGTVTNVPDVTISMTDAMGSATVTVTNYQRLRGEMRRDPFDQVYKKVTDLAWESYTNGKPYVPAENPPAEPVGKSSMGSTQIGKPPVDLPSLDDLLKSSNFDFGPPFDDVADVSSPPAQAIPNVSSPQQTLSNISRSQSDSPFQDQSASLPPLPNLSQTQKMPPSPVPTLSQKPPTQQVAPQQSPAKPTASQQQPLPSSQSKNQQPPSSSRGTQAPPSAATTRFGTSSQNEQLNTVAPAQTPQVPTQPSPKAQMKFGNASSQSPQQNMPPSSPQYKPAPPVGGNQKSSPSVTLDKSSATIADQSVAVSEPPHQVQNKNQSAVRNSSSQHSSQSSSQNVQSSPAQQTQKTVQKERTQAPVLKRPPVGWEHTQEIISRLEETLKSKVLVMYVADGHTISMNDTRFLYTHLRKGGYKKMLHVVPIIPSGHLPVVWRMATLLREFAHEVTIILPDAASVFSTMLALSADMILMNPLGYLSPIETQFTHPLLPSDASLPLSEVLQFAHLASHGSASASDTTKINTLHPLVITAAQRQLALIRLLCTNLLSLPKKKDDVAQDSSSIVDHLTCSYLSADYPITLSEAKQLGLPVSETTEEMNDLLWELIRHYRYLTHPVIAIRDGYRSLEQQACIFESVGRRTLYYLESHEDQRKNIALDTHNRWREVTMQISVSENGKEHSQLVWRELLLVDSGEL